MYRDMQNQLKNNNIIMYKSVSPVVYEKVLNQINKKFNAVKYNRLEFGIDFFRTW